MARVTLGTLYTRCSASTSLTLRSRAADKTTDTRVPLRPLEPGHADRAYRTRITL